VTCNKEVESMNRPWLLAVIGLLLVSFFLPHRYNASDAAAATVRLMEPGRVTDAPKTRFYLQARDVEETEVIALRDRLISGGAEKVNLFVPSMIIVCEVPETVDIRALVTDGRVAVLEEALVASGAGGVAAGVEDLGFVKSCYEMCEKRIAEPDAVAEPVGPPAGFAGMARFVSPEVVAESKALV
jgi:hypothetical protein